MLDVAARSAEFSNRAFAEMLDVRLSRAKQEILELLTERPHLRKFFFEGAPFIDSSDSPIYDDLASAAERVVDVFDRLGFDLAKFPERMREIISAWEGLFEGEFNFSPFLNAYLRRHLLFFTPDSSVDVDQ
jgi:hypothetical protein